MWPNPQFPGDLVTFTKAILDGKLHILCSETCFDIPSYFRSTLADVHVNLHESLLSMKIYS